MMLYCERGNDANRAAEKFLHNSTRFLQIPTASCCTKEMERVGEVGEAQ